MAFSKVSLISACVIAVALATVASMPVEERRKSTETAHQPEPRPTSSTSRTADEDIPRREETRKKDDRADQTSPPSTTPPQPSATSESRQERHHDDEHEHEHHHRHEPTRDDERPLSSPHPEERKPDEPMEVEPPKPHDDQRPIEKEGEDRREKAFDVPAHEEERHRDIDADRRHLDVEADHGRRFDDVTTEPSTTTSLEPTLTSPHPTPEEERMEELGRSFPGEPEPTPTPMVSIIAVRKYPPVPEPTLRSFMGQHHFQTPLIHPNPLLTMPRHDSLSDFYDSDSSPESPESDEDFFDAHVMGHNVFNQFRGLIPPPHFGLGNVPFVKRETDVENVSPTEEHHDTERETEPAKTDKIDAEPSSGVDANNPVDTDARGDQVDVVVAVEGSVLTIESTFTSSAAVIPTSTAEQEGQDEREDSQPAAVIGIRTVPILIIPLGEQSRNVDASPVGESVEDSKKGESTSLEPETTGDRERIEPRKGDLNMVEPDAQGPHEFVPPFRHDKPHEGEINFKFGKDKANLKLYFPEGKGHYDVHDGNGLWRRADFEVDSQGNFELSNVKEDEEPPSTKKRLSFTMGEMKVDLKLDSA